MGMYMQGRWGSAVLSTEGKLWVLGGALKGKSTCSVLTYDARMNSWETRPGLQVLSPGGGCPLSLAFMQRHVCSGGSLYFQAAHTHKSLLS